jgi:hypothetical protein
MKTPIHSSVRGRLLGLLLALGASLLLFAWWRHPSAAATPPALEEQEVVVTPQAPPLLAAVAAAPEPVLPDKSPDDAAQDTPIIDDIQVEHDEVCEGEENLITIKAHTPGGRGDRFLHYAIGAIVGQAIPLRSAVEPADGVGPRMVHVFGRNNASVSVPLPEYTIKKCPVQRMLFLQTRQLPNSAEEYEVVAALRESGSRPLRATSYRWSFGDGEQLVTSTPVAIHRFAPKDAKSLYSHFLLSCVAVGADGESVLGRTALSLRNLEAENLEFHNTLVLSVELTPRFPQLSADGRVVQRVRLYHHLDVPVHLERARVAEMKTFDGDATEGRPKDVYPLLGTDVVPPGRGIEREFTLDTALKPDIHVIEYLFEGKTQDGIPAMADFSIMRPPALPTPETGAPVRDPLLTRKIMRARERLHKEYVNDEDLVELDRQGAFADLEQQAPAEEGEREKPDGHAPTREAMREAEAIKRRPSAN